jgi:hypothetical protein
VVGEGTNFVVEGGWRAYVWLGATVEAVMPDQAMKGGDRPVSELLAGAGEKLRVLRERLAYARTPEFRAEAQRQAALLRDAPEEAEVMDFIEAVMDTDGWEWDWDAVAGEE